MFPQALDKANIDVTIGFPFYHEFHVELLSLSTEYFGISYSADEVITKFAQHGLNILKGIHTEPLTFIHKLQEWCNLLEEMTRLERTSNSKCRVNIKEELFHFSDVFSL